MSDTFYDDLRMDPEAMFRAGEVRADGVRVWRELLFAEPMGFRPLTLSVATPGSAGPHPTVVFVHGGAWMMGHPNFVSEILRQIDVEGRLLAAGFAVAKIAYRMSSEGRFPTQLHDCKAAVRFLRQHAYRLGLDPERFASMGESAGGHLALLVAFVSGDAELEGDAAHAGISSAVRCVVDWYGPTDLLNMDNHRLPHATMSHDDSNSPESLLVGGPIHENVQATLRASPITYVSASSPPVLIQHGTLDRLVPFGQAKALAEALTNKGAIVQLDSIEGADHCFWGVDTRGVMSTAIEFLNRYLR